MSCPDQNLADFHHYRHYEGLRLLPSVCDSKLIQQTQIKLTTGVVSSKTGFQGDVSLYQISAPIQPGNSGGPLFDGNGNLIGIVNAKHKGAENVGYAIKASYLNNLVESAVSSNILPSMNSVSGQPLTNKVKNLRNFVFMIKCSSSQ